MDKIKANSPNGKVNFKDQGLLKFISTFASGTVFAMNFLLKFSMRFLSKREMHETQTKTNVSVALKLTIARFINSSVILVIVNKTP